MQIHFLKHNEINYLKWDETVEKSRNGLVYALSWFLDVVSPGWEALVSDDYEYIMPLTVKKKYGVKYIVQPILCQQLGVFSASPVNADTVNLLIRKIPYLSYEINLNAANSTSKGIALPNYLLDLQHGIGFLKDNFSKNTLRNIANSNKKNLSVDSDVSVEEFLKFYYSEELNYQKPKEVTTRLLIQTLHQKQVLTIRGCRQEDSKLISAVCLIRWQNRIIYLLPISSAKGKESSAMFLIIDKLIEQYAGSEIILDFEGSKIEGIARFYKGFGAKNKPYYNIKKLSINDLLKIIQKK